MTGKQFEVADILKSLLCSSFRFSGVGFFLYLSFKQELQTQLSDFCPGLNSHTRGLPRGGGGEGVE